MDWIRKNASLALGIGLPMVLVVFFILASWVPKLFIDPPKYDVIFLSGAYYGGTNGLDFTVKNGKAEFVHRGVNYGQWPKLYRYSPSTGAVKRIDIPTPEELPVYSYNNPNANNADAQSKIVAVPVPDLEGVKLENSSVSPDGYEFNGGYYRSGGIMGGLFYPTSSRYSSAVLVKQGNRVAIPVTNGDYYYSNKLVGWVIP